MNTVSENQAQVEKMHGSSALSYKIVPVTSFMQNCSIVWCNKSKMAAIIDPGGDPQLIAEQVAKLKVSVQHILLTHGHLDHVGAAVELAKKYDLSITGPQQQDEFWLQGLPMQSTMFGMPRIEAFAPTNWLQEGAVIMVGEQALQVIHTPGHTPGHVVFFSRLARLAWVGDVLFNGGIGRTDFPKGDHATLISSIKDKLLPLGDDVTFIPGHGPTSTFGHERRHNPFIANDFPSY
ncbi:MAG: MBL fold metallo-hydrolase [Vibrionaceae bacterium]